MIDVINRMLSKLFLLTAIVTLAACATSGQEIEDDFGQADEIPSRPGVFETLGGKKLQIEF